MADQQKTHRVILKRGMRVKNVDSTVSPPAHSLIRHPPDTEVEVDDATYQSMCARRDRARLKARRLSAQSGEPVEPAFDFIDVEPPAQPATTAAATAAQAPPPVAARDHNRDKPATTSGE